jgi:hypothetical protein
VAVVVEIDYKEGSSEHPYEVADSHHWDRWRVLFSLGIRYLNHDEFLAGEPDHQDEEQIETLEQNPE